MVKMSFVDKIGILFKLIASSKIYIIIFFILLLMGYILTSRNRKKDKVLKRLCLIAYIIILGIIIYKHRANLGNMFDYMMNNFFIAVYFPNLAIYLAAILTTNIIMWISVFNNKVPRFIRNINVTIYCSMTYLLILILNIIKENNLDVFIQSSVYGNKTAQALIELSSTVFVIWILFLILYKIIKPYFYKQPQKSSEMARKEIQVIEQKLMEPIPVTRKQIVDNKSYREIEAPVIVFGNNKQKQERNYCNVQIPSIVFSNSRKIETEKIYRGIEPPTMIIGNNHRSLAEKTYIKIEAPRVVFANKNIPKDIKPVIKETKTYDDLLTLEDYKLLLSILKEQKQKEQQEKERKARINKEQAKFHELQQLYLNTNPTSF